MGWASGSQILVTAAESGKANIADGQARVSLYRDLLRCVQNMDCDTEDEALEIDPAMDIVILEDKIAYFKRCGDDRRFPEEFKPLVRDLKKAKKALDRGQK